MKRILLFFLLLQLIFAIKVHSANVIDINKGNATVYVGKSNSAYLYTYFYKDYPNKTLTKADLKVKFVFIPIEGNPNVQFVKNNVKINKSTGKVDTVFWAEGIGVGQIVMNVNGVTKNQRALNVSFVSKQFEIVASHNSLANSHNLNNESKSDVVDFFQGNGNRSLWSNIYLALNTYDKDKGVDPYSGKDLYIEWENPKDITKAYSYNNNLANYQFKVANNYNLTNRKRRDVRIVMGNPLNQVVYRGEAVQFTITAKVYDLRKNPSGIFEKKLIGAAVKTIKQSPKFDLFQMYIDRPYIYPNKEGVTNRGKTMYVWEDQIYQLLTSNQANSLKQETGFDFNSPASHKNILTQLAEPQRLEYRHIRMHKILKILKKVQKKYNELRRANDMSDKDLVITSGWASPFGNKILSIRASRSFHIRGNALDIDAGDSFENYLAYQAAMTYASEFDEVLLEHQKDKTGDYLYGGQISYSKRNGSLFINEPDQCDESPCFIKVGKKQFIVHNIHFAIKE